MKELKHILRRFGNTHPAAEVIDYIKLIYQNEFGCGHLCPDEKNALAHLRREWDGLEEMGRGPLCEPIGNGLCRLNLGALRREDLPLAAQAFFFSAQTHKGGEEAFRQKLSLLEEMARKGELPLCGTEVASALKEYLAAGIRPVHHSERYQKQYAPHYRVVELSYGVFFPVLRAAETLLQTGKKAIFAIDGRCASGKSTLAGMMEKFFPCNVFHMDDFFLPPQLRTDERLSAPGGNVHYERFLADVLSPLASGGPFCYRPFCCRDGSLQKPIRITPRPLSVVEGAYSMHPALRKHYQGSAFLTVAPQIQQDRILSRNGKEALRVFNERWIPLEERYFSALKIPDLCGQVVDTSPLGGGERNAF